MNRPLLEDAFDHHVWATLRLIDACAALSPEQLEMTAPGTYGSILSTLRHIVAADSGYLTLLSDGAVPGVTDEQEATLSLAEMRAVMEANAPAWSALLAQDLDPDKIVARRRDDGTDSLAPLGIRINQAVQHGTDHRSQVCTVLTALGVEPPEIDVWAYARAGGRLKVVASAA